MRNYWNRHRLLPTIGFCVAVAIIIGLLFAFPVAKQHANEYNSHSIYEKTDIDFIAPEPSFEQVNELPGTNGISRVFPFYLTNSQVNVGGNTRSSTILLSDQLNNIDFTMYNKRRVIKQLPELPHNYIFVDWQFCFDTGADLGDTVSFSIGGSFVDYCIGAVFETNTLYDGGAIFAPISSEQKKIISDISHSNGYSGIYISTNDYNACQSFLKSDYRPLGRLKDRSQFESDEQYQIHYDAIMSSGYANEITDFQTQAKSIVASNNDVMIYLGALLAAASIIVFNIVMRKRGCEEVFFVKHCITQGQNVKPYYYVSFVCELVFLYVSYAAVLFLAIFTSNIYMSWAAIGIQVFIIPGGIMLSEIIALVLNCILISRAIVKSVNTAKRFTEDTKFLTEHNTTDNEELTKADNVNEMNFSLNQRPKEVIESASIENSCSTNGSNLLIRTNLNDQQDTLNQLGTIVPPETKDQSNNIDL